MIQIVTSTIKSPGKRVKMSASALASTRKSCLYLGETQAGRMISCVQSADLVYNEGETLYFSLEMFQRSNSCVPGKWLNWAFPFAAGRMYVCPWFTGIQSSNV